MASNFDDPSKWRLKTPGGIPYKVSSMDGEFEQVSAGIRVNIMIPSADLIAFMVEMFPPSVIVDDVVIPRYSTFLGSNLRVSKVAFKSFDDSLPIDPFGADANAPEGTYSPVLKLDIYYAPPTHRDTEDPTDPSSFLEVRATTSGEYLHTAPTKVTWQDVKVDGTADGKAQPNRSEHLPCSILNPQTKWSIKWNKIPYSYFKGTVLPRLKLMLGKVNSKAFNVLYTSAPKTLLFTGFDYSFNFTWNSNLSDTPLIDLDMQILEKNIPWKNVLLWPDGSTQKIDDVLKPDGTLQTAGTGKEKYGPLIIRGHCDFWRPGVGWSRLLTNGRETYDAVDFNGLFTGNVS